MWGPIAGSDPGEQLANLLNQYELAGYLIRGFDGLKVYFNYDPCGLRYWDVRWDDDRQMFVSEVRDDA